MSGRVKTFFVIDEYAAAITHAYTGSRTVVVGSLKHEGYKNIDTLSERKIFRSGLKLTREKKLISFYGQPLADVPSYRETIRDYGAALVNLDSDVVVSYRPHPKEPEELRSWTADILKASGRQFLLDKEGVVEKSLCASDLVVSVFSTCCYDVQHLINISTVPLGVPVYLMFNEQLRDWYRKNTRLWSVPMAESNSAYVIDKHDQIVTILEKGLTEDARQECWQDIQEFFPDLYNPSKKIFNTMYNDYKS